MREAEVKIEQGGVEGGGGGEDEAGGGGEEEEAPTHLPFAPSSEAFFAPSLHRRLHFRLLSSPPPPWVSWN